MVERGDTMRSDRLKQVMLEIDPSFNEKEIGFNKFNRFVVEAKSRGLVSIQKMENGQYGIIPRRAPGQAPKKEEAPTEDVKPQARRGGDRRERERPRERRGEKGKEEDGGTRRARPKLTMESALELLNRALDPLLEGEDSVRDSDVKRKLLELDPSFDEGELGYSKFSKFLHAAEEAGAVELTRGPNGNYHVARPKGDKKRRPRGTAQTESGLDDSREPAMKRIARFLFGARPDEAEETLTAVQQQPAAKAEKAEKERRPPRGHERQAERAARHEPRELRRERPPRGPRARTSESEPSAPTRRGGRPGPRQEKGEARPSRGRRRGRGARPATSEARREDLRARERGETTGAFRDEASERARSAEPASRAEAEPPRDSEEVTSIAAELTAEPKVEATPGDEPGTEKRTLIEPAPLPGAPRGTIRGRWGSRGRYRPAAAPPPIFEGQRSPRSGSADDRPDRQRSPADESGQREAAGEPAGGRGAVGATLDERGQPEAAPRSGAGDAELTDAAADLVSQLRSYAGVGERTARTLVEAFGTDLFRVMDEQPDRIREVLPDHRAERVLEARRKELESGGR